MTTIKVAPLMIVASAVAGYLGTIPDALSDESMTSTYSESTEQQPQPQQPGVAQDAASVPESVPEEDMAQQPGETGAEGAQVSEASASSMSGLLSGQGVTIAPQVGMVNFRDTLGNTGNRGTIGFTMDANIAGMAPDAISNLYIGPQVGFIYSHIGSGNAGFFGASPDNPVGSPGTNMFYIPTNLKVGYNMGNFRPSIHAGANLFYRSVASSFALGSNPDTSNDGAWGYLPDLGLDLEYAIAKGVTLLGRPEITFGGSNPVWAASLGASISLG